MSDLRENILHETLKAALGHMLNAKIDLETGATKATALRTLNVGIGVVKAVLDACTLPPEPIQ